MKSVSRALQVLAAIGDAEGGATLTELSQQMDIHKSTLHRTLMTLSEHRLVTRQTDTGRYTLGVGLLALAQTLRGQLAPGPIVRRALTTLRDRTGETIHYAIPDGTQLVYIEKIESLQAVRIASELGDHMELYRTALGKAYLANQPPSFIRRYLEQAPYPAQTSRTLTTARELERALDEIRRRGYAVDDRENEDDVRCIGAAVLDTSGRSIAAVSCTMPAGRSTLRDLPAVGVLVAECAAEISAGMFPATEPA